MAKCHQSKCVFIAQLDAVLYKTLSLSAPNHLAPTTINTTWQRLRECSMQRNLRKGMIVLRFAPCFAARPNTPHHEETKRTV